MKLLIVEDSTLVSRRLAAYFATLPQLEVAVAANAAAAIARFRAWRPDAAILDIGLPDGNGIALLKVFKRERPATRVLMFSNHAYCRASCLGAGADGFFDKADEFEALATSVETLSAATPVCSTGAEPCPTGR